MSWSPTPANMRVEPEGTQILASAEDAGAVIDAVKALGYDPSETVIEAIPSPDEVFWGGTRIPEG